MIWRCIANSLSIYIRPRRDHQLTSEDMVGQPRKSSVDDILVSDTLRIVRVAFRVCPEILRKPWAFSEDQRIRLLDLLQPWLADLLSYLWQISKTTGLSNTKRDLIHGRRVSYGSSIYSPAISSSLSVSLVA